MLGKKGAMGAINKFKPTPPPTRGGVKTLSGSRPAILEDMLIESK